MRVALGTHIGEAQQLVRRVDNVVRLGGATLRIHRLSLERGETLCSAAWSPIGAQNFYVDLGHAYHFADRKRDLPWSCAHDVALTRVRVSLSPRSVIAAARYAWPASRRSAIQRALLRRLGDEVLVVGREVLVRAVDRRTDVQVVPAPLEIF